MQIKQQIVKYNVIVFDNAKEEKEYYDSLPQTFKRNPSIWQKLRILKRDKFKCKICSNSPAIDNDCELEIDHIIPFSKGGRTIDENLQTLCKKCNLKKRNNYEKTISI